MENIDEINRNEEKKTSLFANGLKYGLYTGIAGVLLSLLFYAVDLSRENFIQWIGYAILIAGIVLATVNYRDKINNGYISYGNAFLTGLYVTIVTAVISIAYYYIYITYLDPEFTQYVKDMTEQKLVDKGFSDEMIDQQMAYAEKFSSTSAMVVFGLLWSIVIGAIISLITSAILKKNDDSFGATFNQ